MKIKCGEFIGYNYRNDIKILDKIYYSQTPDASGEDFWDTLSEITLEDALEYIRDTMRIELERAGHQDDINYYMIRFLDKFYQLEDNGKEIEYEDEAAIVIPESLTYTYLRNYVNKENLFFYFVVTQIIGKWN